MVLSEPLFQTLETAIKESASRDFHIQHITPVSGGDINRAYRLDTKSSSYFVKVNNDIRSTSMFLAESTGLALLRQATSTTHTPTVLMVGQAADEGFLLMRWIDIGSEQGEASQESLGRLIATLHRQQADNYGLDHDNFIGRLTQSNTQSTNWSEFFIQQRLQKQLDIAQSQLVGADLQKKFDLLYNRLEELYPKEPPSLLHGDLWSGNYLVTDQGQPVIIDPAVYYGHREMDIAMTKLFGGFTERFYTAYQEVYPLQPGWEQRIDLWSLYPLLVHFNLFGESYLYPLQRSLSTYL